MWIWAVLLTYQKNILPPPGPKWGVLCE
jgi:hypothetical protein